MNQKQIFFIFLRYIFVLILGLFGFSLIYYVFTPLSFYPSLFILKLIFGYVSANFESATFILSGHQIRLVEACIAGSAYFLLITLNLATPMKANQRTKSIIYLCLTFLILNIIRIVIFSYLYSTDFAYYDITHRMVWYFGSTLMVVAIWFSSVHIFKINEIPAYSDLKYIYKQIKTKN
jgi:exosortase/archaeosortase